MVVRIGDIGDRPACASASIGLGIRDQVNRIATADEQIVVHRDIIYAAEIVFGEYRRGLVVRIDDGVVLDVEREIRRRTTTIINPIIMR